MRKRDAIVLVVICGFAVLSAGSLRLGGSSAAKIKMCTANLGKIGQAMAFYAGDFDGKLPLLEFYASPIPSIQSTYLLSRGSPPNASYRHLGCLYGAGYIGDGQSLFCPAIAGWRGDNAARGTNNGTYLGAVDSATGKFADLSRPAGQGWHANLGYCYWPLSTYMATQADLDKITDPSTKSRYKVGLPLSATKMDNLDMARPLVADRRFHGSTPRGWMVNCLHPDGHVTYQPQPKGPGLNGYGVQGTWGMYSMDENCQLPREMVDYNMATVVTDPTEKNYNLATAVSITEFAWALQP
jgi:hypothetical protein